MLVIGHHCFCQETRQTRLGLRIQWRGVDLLGASDHGSGDLWLRTAIWGILLAGTPSYHPLIDGFSLTKTIQRAWGISIYGKPNNIPPWSGVLQLVTEALYKLQSVLVPLTLAIGFAQLFQPVPNPDSMSLFLGGNIKTQFVSSNLYLKYVPCKI